MGKTRVGEFGAEIFLPAPAGRLVKSTTGGSLMLGLGGRNILRVHTCNPLLICLLRDPLSHPDIQNMCRIFS